MEHHDNPDIERQTAPPPVYFGQFLRRTRELEGWTQDGLAFAIQRDRGWLSRVEHNQNLGYLPPPDVVLRLSDVLDVPVARLVLSSYGLSHLNAHDDPGALLPGLDGMLMIVEESVIDDDLKRLMMGCIRVVREVHGHREDLAQQPDDLHHDDDDGHDDS